MNKVAVKHNSNRGGFAATILPFIFAILIAISVRTVVVEPFRIPSGSMKPTLLVGDYIFVSKFSYGISKYSLPFKCDWFSGRIGKLREPVRGEIIVFKKNDNKHYIKRLIGLPGDQIKVTAGVVYINGLPVKRHYVGKFHDEDQNVQLAKYAETMLDGSHYFTLNHNLDDPMENTQVYKVPAGHYFFMGDNRDNSIDSRFTGFIPEESLIGKAQIVFFSSRAKWWEVWKWLLEMDYHRFFKSLDPHAAL